MFTGTSAVQDGREVHPVSSDHCENSIWNRYRSKHCKDATLDSAWFSALSKVPCQIRLCCASSCVSAYLWIFYKLIGVDFR